MSVNNVNIENQDLNFNLFSNNNSNNTRHEYLHGNYVIIIDIINNKLFIMVQNKSESNLILQKYERLYTLKELIEINKIFNILDKIEDSINIIEINKNNFSISIEDNFCIFTIKIDTKEIPKNKISDLIIFKLPLLQSQNNNNSINLINKNLKSLNIGKNYNDNINNNVNNDNNINSNIRNIYLNKDLSTMNIGYIIQNFMLKIDKLTEENKEIRNRIDVLERNNNEIINIIKENRINILKEKYNSDRPTTNNTNSHNNPNNNKIIENENQNNLNYIYDVNALSFCAPQENFNLNDSENENSPNYLTRIHAKYLKEKTKNKNNIINENSHEFKLNKMDKYIDNEKNKIMFNFGDNKDKNDNDNNIIISDMEKKDDDEENYLFTNKVDNEIIDDINFFKNNENIKKIEINNKKNFFLKDNETKKNIMCVDENEEEKREKNNNINIEEDNDDWSINKSYNMVGVVSLPLSRNSSFTSGLINNKKIRKKKENNNNNTSQFNLKKNDSNRGNDYLF